MTEKEKAKAYDKAIERAKKLYSNGIAEEIFPEIKEDNIERIKKNCIHFLELQKQHHAATFEIEECIDWIKKQGKKIEKLSIVVKKLANGEILETKYKDHALNDTKYYKNCRECHIEPDWLLVYKYNNNEIILYLVETGSHLDLFNM